MVLDRIDNRRDPLHEGVKELLFCKLELLHQQMVDNGGVCTVETKRTVERIYRAYSVWEAMASARKCATTSSTRTYRRTDNDTPHDRRWHVPATARASSRVQRWRTQALIFILVFKAIPLRDGFSIAP